MCEAQLARHRTQQLFWLSLALALLQDYLFWGKVDGISFPIFVGLSLGAGFYLARRAGQAAHRRSVWLLLPIAFFALMSAVRLEAMSLFLSRAFTLLLIAWLAASFLGGRWLDYSIGDLLDKLVTFVPKGLARYKSARADVASNKRSWREAAPVLRGLLLALPVLIVLGGLLAAADPFFGNWLEDLFSFLEIENVAEYMLRGGIVLLLVNVLLGVYSYALQASQDEKLLGEAKSLLKPFLGFGETATVLASVDLMFAAFVAFQVRYFFGGAHNISVNGFTYAEYARQGFGEMVAAAVFSLVLFILLSQVGQRQVGRQRWVFSGLGIALMLLVGVMLISAFQRLLLYEEVYGFSQIRTYSHIFMVWLGLLLAAIVVLEIVGRQRAFGLAILGAGLGFAVSLSLLNVDAFIVRANLDRARQDAGVNAASGVGSLAADARRVDLAYLTTLSNDAVPALVAAFERAADEADEAMMPLTAAALLCHAERNHAYAPYDHWQSWHLSRARAHRAWESLQQNLAFRSLDHRFEEYQPNLVRVWVNGIDFDCGYMAGFD